jgi:hypothetical protein
MLDRGMPAAVARNARSNRHRDGVSRSGSLPAPAVATVPVLAHHVADAALFLVGFP